MRCAVIGSGNQGLGIAALLLGEDDVHSVLLLDYEAEAAARGVERLRSLAGHSASEVESGRVDAASRDDVQERTRGCDVVVNATMPEFNLPVMEACLACGAHYLDLYAHPDDAPYADASATLKGQLALDRQFRAAGLTAVPSVGVNPGWVNIAAKATLAGMDSVDAVVIRELEWIDSDELLCSGPPELLMELFLGAPGPLRTVNGEVELVDLVTGEERYDFPQPVGKQGVLPTNGNGTSLQIAAESPVPVGLIEEKFAILSAGLAMKDILLTAVARQTAEHEGAENMFSLFAKSFTPTTAVDFVDAHRKGRIRNAAWVSSVEVRGNRTGVPVDETILCLATLEATSGRIPWAPPGVLATTAVPVEIALRLGRGQIGERGVRPVTTLGCAGALLTDVERRGVVVTRTAAGVSGRPAAS